MTTKKKESILKEAFSLKSLKRDWERAMMTKREEPFLFWSFGSLGVALLLLGGLSLAANILFVYRNAASTKIQVVISVFTFLTGLLGIYLVSKGMILFRSPMNDRFNRSQGLGFVLMIFTIVLWILANI